MIHQKILSVLQEWHVVLILYTWWRLCPSLIVPASERFEGHIKIFCCSLIYTIYRIYILAIWNVSKLLSSIVYWPFILFHCPVTFITTVFWEPITYFTRNFDTCSSLGRRDGLHLHLLFFHLGGGAPLVPGLREKRDLLQSREVDDGLDTTADVNEGVPHRLHQAAECIQRVVVLEGDIRTLNCCANNIIGFLFVHLAISLRTVLL